MEEYGYFVTKRTLASDILSLKRSFVQIVRVKGPDKHGFYLARDFSDSAVNMILDAVNFSNLFSVNDIEHIHSFLKRNVSLPAIDRVTQTTVNITPPEEIEHLPAHILEDIRTAICERKKARVTYTVISLKNQFSEPYQTDCVTVNFKKILICRNRKYALFVRDESPEKCEYIPLKRIKKIEIINLPSVDIQETEAHGDDCCVFNFLNGRATRLVPDITGTVEIKIKKEHIEDLDNSIDSVIQYKKADRDGYCHAKFKTAYGDRLLGFLLLHGDSIQIISPEEPIEEIKNKLILRDSKR